MGRCIDTFIIDSDSYCRLDSGCYPVIDSDCCASLIVYPETITDSDCSLFGNVIRRVRDGVVYCHTGWFRNNQAYEPRIEPQPVNVEPPNPCDTAIMVLDGIFLDRNNLTLDEIKNALVFWPGSPLYEVFHGRGGHDPPLDIMTQWFRIFATLWSGTPTQKQRIAQANEWLGCQ